MKKLFILVIAALTIGMGLETVKAATAATTSGNDTIKAAIAKYKNKNFIGCISDLRIYTTKEPSSAVAWYYLGNSYMNIAMKKDANIAFDKVIELNTVPLLTSYSIQAKLCMEKPIRCKYQKFTYDELVKLKANPESFIEEYLTPPPPVVVEEVPKDAGELEIERLIDGYYSNNIHPSARNFIIQEKAKIKNIHKAS